MNPTVLLLPGLDGTGELFEAFVAYAPGGTQLKRISLSVSGSQSYPSLAEQVAGRMPDGPIHLIAESFSGPLAILLARKVRAVRSIVLCATFIKPPLPRIIDFLPDWLLHRSPPTWMIAALMSGGNWQVAQALTQAVARVSRATLAERIHEVTRVDMVSELSELTIPILCIRATRDRLVPSGATKQIHDANSSCRKVDITAPHLVLQTRPREAWQHIEPFLDDVDAHAL